ncbi:MAG: hypothetical protein M0C28_01830 [Candidatus Moduliflexus flocculans]|nr:hypothetical protein [Candidatus Moduliflexus flocculans]
MGRAGVINIEREADLSGPTHNKGVLILGRLPARASTPRSGRCRLTASLAFEQSYGGVDGDSASSTEVYALLSSLSGLPVRQDLAVTGSLNQKGEIQPIGGVNEKIEGFFDVCQARGLTGTQGVLIPHQNVQNLMLRSDVVDRGQGGKFHVYPGPDDRRGHRDPDGRRGRAADADGDYPEGTVHGLVDRELPAAGQGPEGLRGRAAAKGEGDAGGTEAASGLRAVAVQADELLQPPDLARCGG